LTELTIFGSNAQDMEGHGLSSARGSPSLLRLALRAASSKRTGKWTARLALPYSLEGLA
jgi:hypothetical protein